jgi:hypothetical protein
MKNIIKRVRKRFWYIVLGSLRVPFVGERFRIGPGNRLNPETRLLACVHTTAFKKVQPTPHNPKIFSIQTPNSPKSSTSVASQDERHSSKKSSHNPNQIKTPSYFISEAPLTKKRAFSWHQLSCHETQFNSTSSTSSLSCSLVFYF